MQIRFGSHFRNSGQRGEGLRNPSFSAIAPGQFRSDWSGRSMIRTERTISAYDKLMDPVRKARQEKSGKQPGEPAKAAEVLLKILEAEQPPTHLCSEVTH